MSEQIENLQNSEPVTDRTSGNESTAHDDVASSAVVHSGGGPRTIRGKEKSKHNALKHGIFSKVAVLKGESQVEFDALMTGFFDDLQPVGTLERSFVEILAHTRWRQRRLAITEQAEIEAARGSLECDEKERQREDGDKLPSDFGKGGLIREIANPVALDACLRWLIALRFIIYSCGYNLEKMMPILNLVYGDFSERYWRLDLLQLLKGDTAIPPLPEDMPEDGKFPPPKTGASDFAKDLDEEIKRLLRLKRERKSVESNRMKLKLLCRCVPDSPRFDQLLRYLSTLERIFDRTLNQLERVQRMRRGQPVAPRIEVNVESS